MFLPISPGPAAKSEVPHPLRAEGQKVEGWLKTQIPGPQFWGGPRTLHFKQTLQETLMWVIGTLGV